MSIVNPVTIKGKTFRIDTVLQSNMNDCKKRIKLNWDNIFMVDGMEGSAKSTLSQMLAYYLSDGEFAIEDIVFTAEQFEQRITDAKPNTAIVFDEMVMAGLAGDAVTSMQRVLVKQFTLIRKKQLHIILVIPYLFMLQKYFALSRTRFLIHCYSPDSFERGHLKFYSYPKKNSIYTTGYKFWNYNAQIYPDFISRFDDYTGMFVDKEAYEQKKDDTIKRISEKQEKKDVVLTPKDKEYLIKCNFSTIFDNDSVERRHLDLLKTKIKENLTFLGNKDI
jgi:hypothetical protein